MAKSKKPRRKAPLAIDPNSRATVSGPAEPRPLVDSSDDLTAKMAATQQLAAALPFNANKALEYDPEAAIRPEPGVFLRPPDPIVGSSTVQEKSGSDKVGSGGPVIGENKTNGPLDRVRVDSSQRALTTNQGVPVADNQNSLKAGLRGPTLLEDFILREKITHFDHERIPERIVHARGSAAHGVFQCTKALGESPRRPCSPRSAKRRPCSCAFPRCWASGVRRTPHATSAGSR
jgi:catalase